MAFTVTNQGLEHIVANAISSSTDIRMVVFKGTVPAVATMRDWSFVSDAIASTLDEAAASGYTRPDLASVTVTASDASDNVTITAAAPVLTSVASGETWTCVGYFIQVGADTANPLIGIDVPTPSTLATNGQNVTLPALLLTVTGS